VDISTLANLVNAIAVTAGVIFAATQIRDYRRQRRRESMLSLVRSFQSPTFAQALRRVVELPNGTSGKQIREILGPSGEDTIAHLTGTWESIGVLVFHNELTLDVVDDFFSGPIVLSWKKLQPYVEHLRQQYNRDTWSEWFQWLAERMMERESKLPAVPATSRIDRTRNPSNNGWPNVAKLTVQNLRRGPSIVGNDLSQT
jgi:hypothetical protein